MKSENIVQREIIDYIKDHGGWIIKVMKANENGCPDLLACVPYKDFGLFVAVEVKAEQFVSNPWAHASAWQKKQINKIEQAQGLSMCVASLSQYQLRLKVFLSNL